MEYHESGSKPQYPTIPHPPVCDGCTRRTKVLVYARMQYEPYCWQPSNDGTCIICPAREDCDEHTKDNAMESYELHDGDNLSFETKCDCGQQVTVVQDANDSSVFHFECHACGNSKTLTKREPNP